MQIEYEKDQDGMAQSQEQSIQTHSAILQRNLDFLMKVAELPILGQLSSNIGKAIQTTTDLASKCHKKIMQGHTGKKREFRDRFREMQECINEQKAKIAEL